MKFELPSTDAPTLVSIGVDIKDISQGMGSDQRIGDRFLRAWPAYWGSCLPKDKRALIDLEQKFKTVNSF